MKNPFVKATQIFESPPCPKCGRDKINVTYSDGHDFNGIVFVNNEHLACRCNFCQYEWAEDCIDKEMED